MFKLSRIEFSGSRKSSLVLGALVAFTTTLPGCDSPAAMTPLSASVTGTVTYRERIALPPNAVATIRLQDVSLQDVAAIPIGIQIITDTGQVPSRTQVKCRFPSQSATFRRTLSRTALIQLALESRLTDNCGSSARRHILSSLEETPTVSTWFCSLSACKDGGAKRDWFRRRCDQ